TSTGTSNLTRHTADQCDHARGVAIQSETTSLVPTYSEARYRTLLAMHCATDHRPFNYVTEKYSKLQIEMFFPGTPFLIPQQSPQMRRSCTSKSRPMCGFTLW
ncbi:hypothetical protein C8R44DRAFT_919964, partial [Mycena epipterygia]